MITLLKNAIPPELIQKIRERCGEQVKTNNKSAFGRMYHRVGETVNISSTPALKDVDDDIAVFMQSFIQRFVSSVLKPAYGVADSGYEFHRYEAGEQCLVHTDQDVVFTGNNADAFLRFATVILHLNTVNNGGETIFPNQNQSYKTVEGQILVFPPTNAYPHYVTPSEETRDIVMTWLVYETIRVVRM